MQYIYSHPSFGDMNYPPGRDCVWNIMGTRKHQNMVLIMDSFEVEYEDKCSYDYLGWFSSFNHSLWLIDSEVWWPHLTLKFTKTLTEIKSYGQAPRKKCKTIEMQKASPGGNGSNKLFLVLPGKFPHLTSFDLVWPRLTLLDLINSVTLKFHADDTISKKGFRLRYQIAGTREPIT